jgi:hypothetical protein
VSGALDSNVDAAVGLNNGDKIRGMVASSTRLYVSGGFTQIDDVSRRHLAAFERRRKPRSDLAAEDTTGRRTQSR